MLRMFGALRRALSIVSLGGSFFHAYCLCLAKTKTANCYGTTNFLATNLVTLINPRAFSIHPCYLKTLKTDLENAT